MSGKDEITRVAVAGIGGRGVWAAGELAGNSRFELVALCDPYPSRMDFAKSEKDLNGVACYRSIEQCMTEEDIDAVVVTSLDGAHAEIVVPALEAGKYVFVEKPLEVTEDKCRAIVEADIKAGGKTFVGFNLRFAPVYVKMKELIDQGVIGDVLTIQADEFYDGGRTYFRRWNRLREFGGGLWITKASHDFDLLYWMAGKRKPVSVHAFAELSYYKPREDAALYCRDCKLKETCPDCYEGWKKVHKVGKNVLDVSQHETGVKPDLCLYNADKDTFDHGVATVQFEDAVLATYTCNVVAGFSDRRMRVSGTKGTLDGSLSGETIVLQKRDPSEKTEIKPEKAEGGHGGADIHIFEGFHKFTQGQGEPKVRPTEAIIPILMGLAATRSGDEKRRVEMSEFGL